MANVVWEAAPAPTNAERGRGTKWEWPAAYYAGAAKKPAAFIVSPTGEECNEAKLNSGRPERPLVVILMAYNMGAKKNLIPNDPLPDAHRVIPKQMTFDRLEVAMMWVEAYLSQHPHWQPLIV